jgi:hypothetical protein
MNGLNRKLRALEQNVLDLPEDNEINLYIKDGAEMALHERAHKIKQPLQETVKNIMFSGELTFEQQNAKAKELFKELSQAEQRIINESEKFIRFRLMRLLFKQFSPVFPKVHHSEVWQRIVWFFGEMDKLVIAKAIEDSEWDFNRDEDDPTFNDYAWWDELEAKIRECYPNGVFTRESYETIRDFFDEKEAELIREYWKAHPEEFKEYMEQIDKRLENLKNRA